MPFVSIVMSVYNAELYLAEAIESILGQTYQNFEFIIIDDGSADGSLEKISFYQKRDARIKVISRENKGLAYSLNEGIRLAQGKYIVRMDADDISLPYRLETQVKFMESSPNVGVCGSAVVFFGEEGGEKVWKLTQNDAQLKSDLLFSSVFAHPTVIIRKEIIFKYNLFYNEAFLQAQDFELWSRMAPYTQFFNLKKPLVKYRVSKNGITGQSDLKIEKRYHVLKQIFDNYLQQLKMHNSEEENRLHFNLTVNTRIRDNQISIDQLNNYFSKIIDANKKYKVFHHTALKKTLGKKWLWNFYYRPSAKALYSSYLFYGIWSMIKK